MRFEEYRVFSNGGFARRKALDWGLYSNSALN